MLFYRLTFSLGTEQVFEIRLPSERPQGGLHGVDQGVVLASRIGPASLQDRRRPSTRVSISPLQLDLLPAARITISFAPSLSGPADAWSASERLPGYAREFLGHGIGLGAHEEPRLHEGNSMILEPGMVICIEQSSYVDGAGFHFGDSFVIEESGLVCWTTALSRTLEVEM